MLLKPIEFRDHLDECSTDREVGQLRLYSALDWTFRWQFTTAALIADLLGSTDRRHYRWLTSWERQDLIRRTPTLSPIAREVITLTRMGVSALQTALAGIGSEELLPQYQHDVSRINLRNLTHSLATQIAVLKLISAGKIDCYATEHELASTSRKGVKQPDALLGKAENTRIALEVELTPKSHRLLDQALIANIDLLRDKKVDGIWYVSHVPAILNSIRRALESGHITKWRRDDQYKWSRNGRVVIEKAESARFLFQHLPELARLYP